MLTRKPEPLLDKDIDRAMDIVEYVTKNDIGVITYNDPAYPQRLKALDNCPILLYYKGTLHDFDTTPSVGVVGTRRYSALGERITKRVSYDLARSGFTIVSGLAKGIDSFSHKAALYNKSKTVAVLGCGIDVIYPSENRELTLRMHEHGLVITEFSPGTPPAAWNFPARNRIISALSDAVFVAECTLKSGTIITADHALKHQIPVYMNEQLCADAVGYLRERGAVSIVNSDRITADFKERYSQLRLISELEPERKLEPEEIIVTVSPLKPFRPSSRKTHDKTVETEINTPKIIKNEHISNTKNITDTPKTAEFVYKELGGTDASIMNMLEKGAMSVDELAESGIPVSELLKSLTALEIKGFISSLAGGKYVKILS